MWRWQVVWESQLGGADEAALQDALLQRLAEKEEGYYGRPGLARPVSKGAAPGGVCMFRLGILLNMPALTGSPGHDPGI